MNRKNGAGGGDRHQHRYWRNPVPPLLVLLLLFAVAAGAQSTKPSGAQSTKQLLQQANQALQKKDYAAASQALEAYLAQKPDDYRAEFNLAYAYSLSGRRQDAITHYRNVLARQPGLIPAHLNLGILLVESGHPDEAESHLRAVLEKEPDNFDANLYLADALAALKRVPEASEAFEHVLRLKPNDAHVHFAYARLLGQSNPTAAEEQLRRAVQIDPSLDEAWLDLATLIEDGAAGDAGALGEAAAIYQRELNKHPDRRDLHIRLGEIDAARKQFPAAAKQLEMARAAGDSSLAVAKNLLQAYLHELESERPAAQNRENLAVRLTHPEAQPAARNNETEQTRAKALVLVREILTRDPGNFDLHLLSGQLRMEDKQYREAALEFQRAIQLRPNAAEGYTNLASALYLLGAYAATVGALERVSALHRDTAGTYFLRAICLDKLHVRKPALENYQKFLALDAGKNPDQEFQARQRGKLLKREIEKGITAR